MLKAMADNNVNITTREDACMYDAIAGQETYVLKGIDSELIVESKADSLVVKLKKGGGVIHGRHFYELGESTSLTLEANTSGFLVIRYDLTQTIGKEVSFLGVPLPLTQNINNDGGVACDLVLYSYVTNEVGVTSLVDKRSFYNDGKSIITASFTITPLEVVQNTGQFASTYPYVYRYNNSSIKSDMIPTVQPSVGVNVDVFGGYALADDGYVDIYFIEVPTININVEYIKLDKCKHL